MEELSIAHRMSVKEYQDLTPYSERLEENWGKPPGNLNSDGQNFELKLLKLLKLPENCNL